MARPAPGDVRRGERGYNLVALAIGITIMNILLAASLPLWSQAIRREKEEELIFRGLQYAEAIRVFRNRFNRYPPRLEDLVEVKPRSIRQLWKDPLTEDGKWGLIFDQQPFNPQTPGDDLGGADGDGRNDAGDSAATGLGGSGIGRAPAKGTTVAVGPIRGVYSLSDKESVMVWNGQQQYNRWAFTVDLLLEGAPPPGSPPPQIGPVPKGRLVLSNRWIGRPLRPFLTPQGGTLPDGTPIPGGPGLPGFNSPTRPLPPGAPSKGPSRRPPGGSEQ